MKVFELLVLLSDDLFVLKTQKLPFFFKVSDNLAETFLQQIDLRLHQLDFLCLLELLLGQFLHCETLLFQVCQRLLVVQFELRVSVV